jgi:predicted dehydrogenase
VVAVAARDEERAKEYAKKHSIPIVHKSYEALLEDPNIDAVYIGLPNSLHCRWTVAALEAGKHVLCEKPFANNEDEAQRMAIAAQRANRLVVEAFHNLYHPMAARVKVLASAALGAWRRGAGRGAAPSAHPRRFARAEPHRRGDEGRCQERGHQLLLPCLPRLRHSLQL